MLCCKSTILPFFTCVPSQYAQLYNVTLGNHEYEKDGDSYTPLLLCQTYYRNGTVYPGDESFEIDAQVESGRFELSMEKRETETKKKKKIILQGGFKQKC